MDRSRLRPLLRPGWVVTHLAVIAIAVLFVNLGLWQLERHGEVAEDNERVQLQLRADPVAVEDLLSGSGPDDVDFLAGSAIGTYARDADVVVSPRTRNANPGRDVLTPLVLRDGRVLMVNRGWVPLDADVPPPPTEVIEVRGRLRDPAKARQAITDDAGRLTLLSNVDLERLAQEFPALIGVAYLERVDDVALEAGTLPRPAIEVTLDSGPHLLYALQWFAFTVIGLVGYPLLLRRRLLDESRPSPVER